MALRWTSHANADLVRLHEYLQPVNPAAATRVVQQLIAGASRVPRHPRLGTRLHQFDPREVRRVVVGDYEIRYELTGTDLFALRIFHIREDR